MEKLSGGGNIQDVETTEEESIVIYFMSFDFLGYEGAIQETATVFNKSIEEIKQIIKEDESTN